MRLDSKNLLNSALDKFYVAFDSADSSVEWTG